MAGTIIADTLTHSTAGSLTTDYVVNGSNKAWGMIDGTGTVAYRDSFGTSSLTDSATGIYTMTFSSAMSNANYACPSACGGQETTSTNNLEVPNGGAPTTTAIIAEYSNGNQDCDFLSVSILGDLA